MSLVMARSTTSLRISDGTGPRVDGSGCGLMGIIQSRRRPLSAAPGCSAASGSFLSFRTRHGSRIISFGCKKSAKDVLRWNFGGVSDIGSHTACPLSVAHKSPRSPQRSQPRQDHSASASRRVAPRAARPHGPHMLSNLKICMPSMPVHKRLLDSCWTLIGRLALSV